jgi:hypothetical protein
MVGRLNSLEPALGTEIFVGTRLASVVFFVVALHFVPFHFVPGHFVPVISSPHTFRPRSFRPRSSRPLVILSLGHFVPLVILSHFVPELNLQRFMPGDRDFFKNVKFHIHILQKLLQASYCRTNDL